MKDKKIILFGIALIIVALFVILVIATSETLIVSVDDVNASAGEEDVYVPINLTNNVTVYGFQLGISHSPDVIFKNISLTSRMNNAIIESNDIGGEILIAAVLEEGISPANGTILNLIFDISSPANGTYALNSTDILGADLDTDLYTVEFIPGEILIN